LSKKSPTFFSKSLLGLSLRLETLTICVFRCGLCGMAFLAQTLEIFWVIVSAPVQRHDVITLQANNAATTATLDLYRLVLLGFACP
jgi:hypothetical protein